MRSGRAYLSELYGLPGAKHAATPRLRTQTASLHASLLRAAAASPAFRDDLAIRTILAFLDGPFPVPEKQDLLDHPLLLDALHAAAGRCARIRAWDEAVAPDDPTIAPSQNTARAKLGNIALRAAVTTDATWSGTLPLDCDPLGDVHFPATPWKLSLVPLAGATPTTANAALRQLAVRVTPTRAEWFFADASDEVVLSMPREDLRLLLQGVSDAVDPTGWQSPYASARLQFRRAARLHHSRLQYDSIIAGQSDHHAALTGAIVDVLMLAIRQNSPHVAREMEHLVTAIRGFEIPTAQSGTLESFSNPRLPGIVGFNVTYSGDEPRISPFCFTALAHELGHTKQYLIEDVVFAAGGRCLTNGGQSTPVLPRYGRSVSVRTLFHIAYVHFYEWVVLMDFIEHGYQGVPWPIRDDAIAFGDDIAEEIREAWQWLAALGRLTSLGRAVVARQHAIFAHVFARWQRVKRDVGFR